MAGTNIANSHVARGGKSIYGAPLGILMLEARFPRIPGDMGNGTTWPFPVLFRVVRGASPERVVLADPEAQKKLADLGNTPRYETLDEFKATVKRDRAKWSEVVKSVGATIE